jgi:uncharacterized protein (DUF302 family)
MKFFRIFLLLVSMFFIANGLSAEEEEEHLVTDIIHISQTVMKLSVSKNVSSEEASQAMISKAADLNLKLVGRQMIHKELEARGFNPPHIEILQFCDPVDAMKMVKLDPLYSAYMPCRISLVEDQNGRPWLYMLNLDMLVNSNSLPPELQAIAIRINQNMLAVITAGATGEF